MVLSFYHVLTKINSLPPSSLLISGHAILTLSEDDLGPTNVPLRVPSAMIVYVTPHSRLLKVTVAIVSLQGIVSNISNICNLATTNTNI